METIIKGENKIVLFNLTSEDGSDLPLSSLASLTVEIQQNGFTLVTYTYGTDHELEQGSSPSQLKMEVRTSLSTRFVPGIVSAIITTQTMDSDFDIDQKQIDKSKIEMFEVE